MLTLLLIVVCVAVAKRDFSVFEQQLVKSQNYPGGAVAYFGGLLFANLTYMKIPMPEAHYNCYIGDGMSVLIKPTMKVYNLIQITGDIVISRNDTSNVQGFGWGMADYGSNSSTAFDAVACWDGTPWTMYVAVGCWNLTAWNMTCP